MDLFNDLPKAGTFDHDNWTQLSKVGDLGLDAALPVPSLLDGAIKEKEEEEKKDVTFSDRTKKAKKPDKVTRRENARLQFYCNLHGWFCHFVKKPNVNETSLHRTSKVFQYFTRSLLQSVIILSHNITVLFGIPS